MRELLKPLIVLCVVGLAIFILFKVSPNFRYFALPVGTAPIVNYLVIDRETGQGMFTTHPEFDTPNDVKDCGFSADSTKFAAVYHYGYGANAYTWFGVWSTKTSNFLYSKTKRGWTTDLSGVFDE